MPDLETILMNAGTILWNGPLGFFEKENFDKGTIKIAKMICSSKGFSVAGGGDTIAAAQKAGVLGQTGLCFYSRWGILRIYGRKKTSWS